MQNAQIIDMISALWLWLGRTKEYTGIIFEKQSVMLYVKLKKNMNSE